MSVTLDESRKKSSRAKAFIQIYLKLKPDDLIEFKKIFEVEKKSFDRREKLTLPLNLLLLIPILLIAIKFRPNGLPYLQTLLLILLVTVLVLATLVISILLTKDLHYPYTNPTSYSWKLFFENRGIDGFTKANMYNFVKSYIDETNSISPH